MYSCTRTKEELYFTRWNLIIGDIRKKNLFFLNNIKDNEKFIKLIIFDTETTGLNEEIE